MIDLAKTKYEKGDLLVFNGNKFEPLKKDNLLFELTQEVRNLRHEVATLSSLAKKQEQVLKNKIVELYTETINELIGVIE